MAREKRIGLAGGILVALSILTSSLAAQDIQVPAEFLFGRWAQGHYLRLDGTYRDEREPVHRNSYTYTRGSLRVSLGSLGRYLLWSEEDGRTQSAALSVYWRPSGNIQCGIEDVNWLSVDSDLGSGPTKTSRYQFSTQSAKPQFHYANAETFTITPEHARFWYLIDNFLESGQLLSRTSAHFTKEDRETSDRWQTSTPLLQSGQRWSDVDDRTLNVTSSFAYGLWRDVAVKAEVFLTAHWVDANSIYNYYEPDSTYSRTYLSDGHTARLYYTVEVLTMPLPSLYLSFGANSTLATSGGSVIQRVVVNDTIVDADTLPYSTGPVSDNEYTRLSVRTDYITAGEFNPAILLDDYQDFYGRQLFAGQVQVSAEFAYHRPAHTEWRSAYIPFTVNWGTSNRLQLGLIGDYLYSYRRNYDGASSRSLDASLAVQYRSYDYDPAKGPGWHRDPQHDVAFGVLPKFGQWLIAAQVEAIYGSSHGEFGGSFFDFDDMDFERRLDRWELSHTFGLGRGVAINSAHWIDIDGGGAATWHIADHAYILGLQVRLGQKVQFSGSFNHYYHRSYTQNPPPIWNLQLQVLL